MYEKYIRRFTTECCKIVTNSMLFSRKSIRKNSAGINTHTMCEHKISKQKYRNI